MTQARPRPPLIRELSAGGLVVRRFRARPWLAVVRVRNGLALPKGIIDPGETPAETALREVREEAGLDARLVEKLGDVRYWYTRPGGRVFKIVSFFLFPTARAACATTTTRCSAPSGSSSPRPRRGWPTAASGRWPQGRPVGAALRPGRLLRRVRPQLLLAGLHRPAQARPQDRHDPARRQEQKYRKGEVVLVTVGFQHSPRERIFEAVIDAVEVKRVSELSPRDIEHDNPEFRRLDETIHFLEQIYGRKVERGRRRHRRALLQDLGPPVRDRRAPAARRPAPELVPVRIRHRATESQALALSLLECQP